MTDTWPSLLSARGAQFDASGHARFERASAPASVSLIPLLHEASILVAGADAESFLQGQLSNDIRQITNTQGQPAAYCTPKGRVLATFSIWPQEGGYVLRLPVELADRIRKRLQMYVLRSRVTLEDVSGHVALLGLAGPGSVPLLEGLIGKAPRSPFAIIQANGMSTMALPGQRIEIAVRPDSAAALWDGPGGGGRCCGGAGRLGTPGPSPQGLRQSWRLPAINSYPRCSIWSSLVPSLSTRAAIRARKSWPAASIGDR
jgi:hypothetical protein